MGGLVRLSPTYHWLFSRHDDAAFSHSVSSGLTGPISTRKRDGSFAIPDIADPGLAQDIL